ncbi:MAG: hypothetical protein RR603_04770 [Kurthia sp.]
MFFLTTLIALLYEFFLALPFIGGATVVASGYTALTVAFVIHAIVFGIRALNGRSKVVPITAMLLTLVAWIPIVGWIAHIIIFVLYIFDLIAGLFTTNKA